MVTEFESEVEEITTSRAGSDTKVNFVTDQIVKAFGIIMMLVISGCAWFAVTVFTDMKDSINRIEKTMKESVESVEAKISSVGNDVQDIKVSFGRVDERVQRNTLEIIELKRK